MMIYIYSVYIYMRVVDDELVQHSSLDTLP